LTKIHAAKASGGQKDPDKLPKAGCQIRTGANGWVAVLHRYHAGERLTLGFDPSPTQWITSLAA